MRRQFRSMRDEMGNVEYIQVREIKTYFVGNKLPSKVS